MKRTTVVLGLSGLLLTCSCARIHPLKISPRQAGATAIAEYDQDGDGLLSTAELEACPGILARLTAYDTDSDGSVAAEEIAARIVHWQSTRAGVLNMSCSVSWAGKPLAGATVSLQPEAFLGDAVKPATGTTDRFGATQLAIPIDQLPDDQQNPSGAHLGIYKVRITHPQRKLPAKYNTESMLGREIDHADQWNGIKFDLVR